MTSEIAPITVYDSAVGTWFAKVRTDRDEPLTRVSNNAVNGKHLPNFSWLPPLPALTPPSRLAAMDAAVSLEYLACAVNCTPHIADWGELCTPEGESLSVLLFATHKGIVAWERPGVRPWNSRGFADSG